MKYFYLYLRLKVLTFIGASRQDSLQNKLTNHVIIVRFLVTTIPEEEHHAEVKRRESAVDAKDLPRRPSAVIKVTEDDE